MAAPLERKECFGEDCIDVLDPQPLEVIAPEVEAKKRKSAPGVRVVGRRIYDPENGKTCHQCRQKTTDFAAACKQVKKKGPCPIKYCQKCLLNRYGENAEEATRNEDWICPKCRGICNCSFCRKKKGEMPTGIMAHIAKASGCTSVHDLLEKGSDVVAAAQAILKVNGNDKDLKRARGTDADKVATERDENVDIDINTVPSDEGDENIGVDLNALPSVRIKQRQKLQHNLKKNHADERSHGGGNGDPLLSNESPDSLNSNIVLPRGTPVVNIAGAKLDDEDIGAAIQFLEFCRAFAEIFQIRKGQPERILQDVVGGRELRLVSSVVAEFHINLLSVIQEGKGKKPLAYTRDGDAWGISGYKILNPSCKLRVLNFLCDETLSTDKLRNWIDNQNGIAAEPMNAARGKARAAKEKEKKLKERLKLNMDTTVLSPNEAAAVSDEENKDIISQIKEAQEVKRAAINDMATIDKGGGLWTKPLMVEKGIAYWKLDGYCDNTTMLLQEYGDDELMANKDKWFIFTEDEEKAIEEHVATR
ncbi:hypothetical protein U9M48_024179 [Paspalum notatum var. saurae]|uniref:DDT domain-containing protein n=1 Tax=Paspalum notatum var. saurae TaxID=547442 RepID=A0AAQ3TSE2_PASNO